jgi:dTDP-glucose 4,6-dehydratase
LQWRDYNYVSDFCEALDLIIHQENPLPLYHIAANDERQNIETVKTILRLMNKSESLIEYVEDPRGSAHDPCYSLDCSNVKKLGWAPKTSFEDGILKTVDFYAKKLAL